MTLDSSETNRILQQAARGDGQVLGTLLARHRDRLRRMVALRLDRRLQGRIDPSDVIQEAYLEASARLAEYLRNPVDAVLLVAPIPRRPEAGDLASASSRASGCATRASRSRWIMVHLPEASSAALAAQLLGHEARPSEAAIRAEMKARVQEALDGMAPLDREVLALRHFEQLSRAEIAQVLNVSEAAAGKRYIRALERLKQVLGRSPGGLEGLRP